MDNPTYLLPTIPGSTIDSLHSTSSAPSQRPDQSSSSDPFWYNETSDRTPDNVVIGDSKFIDDLRQRFPNGPPSTSEYDGFIRISLNDARPEDVVEETNHSETRSVPKAHVFGGWAWWRSSSGSSSGTLMIQSSLLF